MQREFDEAVPSVAAAQPAIPGCEPFWGYRDLLLFIGLLVPAILLLLGAVGVAALAYPSLRIDPTPIAIPVQLLLYVLIYLIFWVVLTTRYQQPVLRGLGWVTPTNFRLWWAVIGGLLMAPLVALLLVALHTPKIHSPLEDMLKSTPLLIGFGLIAVTVAPLFEEMVFRGFLQPLIGRSLGTLGGILIPAVLFGCLHLPEYSSAWQSAVAISAVGIALGYVRLRSRSLIPSTLMHCAYNGVLITLAVAAKFNPKLSNY